MMVEVIVFSPDIFLQHYRAYNSSQQFVIHFNLHKLRYKRVCVHHQYRDH